MKSLAARLHRVPLYAVSGCLLWGAFRNRDGYGRLQVSGMKVSAHRLSYYLASGAFDPALHVLHRCDQPACVLPAHLFTGTPQDNMADRDAKGRGVVPIRAGGRWTGRLRWFRRRPKA